MGSLGLLGSSSVVAGNDALLGLRVLNRMLDAWRQQPQMATHSAWVQFALPSGATTRTIGLSGQVNVARPVEISIGSYVDVNGISRPLELIGRDQYAAITVKTTGGTWPSALYYEPSNPIGTLHFWPPAGSDTTINLAVRADLPVFATLVEDHTLPAGYEACIVPNLAVLLGPYFERAVPPDVRIEAATTRANIKRTNAIIPTLDMDRARRGRSAYGDFLAGV